MIMTMGETLTDLRWLGSQDVLEANGHGDRRRAILTVYGAYRFDELLPRPGRRTGDVCRSKKCLVQEAVLDHHPGPSVT
ncbi:MAG: hypothetical protein M3R02_20555 [Chloroflexota bacterium]|nr:hypothetical protein [Chloroflexota bacterium]